MYTEIWIRHTRFLPKKKKKTLIAYYIFNIYSRTRTRDEEAPDKQDIDRNHKPQTPAPSSWDRTIGQTLISHDPHSTPHEWDRRTRTSLEIARNGAKREEQRAEPCSFLIAAGHGGSPWWLGEPLRQPLATKPPRWAAADFIAAPANSPASHCVCAAVSPR